MSLAMVVSFKIPQEIAEFICVKGLLKWHFILSTNMTSNCRLWHHMVIKEYFIYFSCSYIEKEPMLLIYKRKLPVRIIFIPQLFPYVATSFRSITLAKVDTTVLARFSHMMMSWSSHLHSWPGACRPGSQSIYQTEVSQNIKKWHFHVPTFSNGAWPKNDQPHMPKKFKLSRHPIRCTHQATCWACTQKSGYNS